MNITPEAGEVYAVTTKISCSDDDARWARCKIIMVGRVIAWHHWEERGRIHSAPIVNSVLWAGAGKNAPIIGDEGAQEWKGADEYAVQTFYGPFSELSEDLFQ